MNRSLYGIALAATIGFTGLAHAQGSASLPANLWAGEPTRTSINPPLPATGTAPAIRSDCPAQLTSPSMEMPLPNSGTACP